MLGGATLVDATTLAPQDDGFHFLIDKAGVASAIQFWRTSGRGYGGFEFGSAPYEVAYVSAPNAFWIRCMHRFSDDLPDDAVAVNLVDPAGVFHRSSLDCATKPVRMSGAMADPDETPEVAILRLVPGIVAGDVAEYTRYPVPRNPIYRVLCADKIIARLTTIRWPPGDPDAPWSISGEACRASGLG